MDYTLSQYKPETFEKLAHDLTVEKLVSVFGYPEVTAITPRTCLHTSCLPSLSHSTLLDRMPTCRQKECQRMVHIELHSCDPLAAVIELAVDNLS